MKKCYITWRYIYVQFVQTGLILKRYFLQRWSLRESLFIIQRYMYVYINT